MEHICYMFMFDNAAGWVDENPPYSDFKYAVSWLVPSTGESGIIHTNELRYVESVLDAIGAATDDRN